VISISCPCRREAQGLRRRSRRGDHFHRGKRAQYTPAHEKVEWDLGIVPEITVLRTKLRGDQVNQHTDVYKKWRCSTSRKSTHSTSRITAVAP